MRKKTLAVVVASLAGVVAQGVSARETITLVHGGKRVETITATVNGQKGTYLFDSGIGVTGMTPPVASAVGCHPWGRITGLRATGERLDVPRCNAITVALDAYTRPVGEPAVYDLAKFMGPAATGLSGAIGLDVFRGQVVTLDIAHHQVIVEDAASLADIRKTAIEVPIRSVRAAEGAALTVDLGLETTSGMAWMELDTGNYGPSMLNKTVAALFGADPTDPNPQAFHAHAAKGVDLGGQAVVKDLIMDGNLGRGVLRDMQVTLDLQNDRGWITMLEPTFSEKVESMARKIGH